MDSTNESISSQCQEPIAYNSDVYTMKMKHLRINGMVDFVYQHLEEGHVLYGISLNECGIYVLS